jgi:transposase-like protein
LHIIIVHRKERYSMITDCSKKMNYCSTIIGVKNKASIRTLKKSREREREHIIKYRILSKHHFMIYSEVKVKSISYGS